MGSGSAVWAWMSDPDVYGPVAVVAIVLNVVAWMIASLRGGKRR